MPELPFPDQTRTFLQRPNPAVIATLRPDGQPVSVPTWYLLDRESGRDQVVVNMDEGRRRLGYLRADPRVSLTVLGASDWYTHVSIQGRVTRLADDDGLVVIDRMSQAYRGRPYDSRDRRRVNAWIEVDRWHGWGALRST